jgi:hypothetical protein
LLVFTKLNKETKNTDVIMRFRTDFELEARIAGLYIGKKAESLITNRYQTVDVTVEGFKGDRHSGITKPSGGREARLYPEKGTSIKNNRQWSAISDYELSLIAQGMDVPEVKAEWVGANMLLQGVPNLTKLPSLTYLIINWQTKDHTILVVYEENLPCIAPGEVIGSHYGTEKTKLFPKVAMGHRGIVGWVERGGIIRENAPVRILFPTTISDKQLEIFRK